MAIKLGSVLPSLGSALGSGLSQGIGQGLDLLAQGKMAQLQQAIAQQQAQAQQERAAQGFQGLGISPQFSSALALLDPSLQKSVLANLGDVIGLQGQQAPQSGLQALLQGQGVNQQPSGLDALRQAQAAPQQPSGLDLLRGQQPQESGVKVSDLFKSPQQKEMEKRTQISERKAKAQEDSLRLKEGQAIDKIISPIVESAQAADKDIPLYKALKEKAKKGDLISGNWKRALNLFGIDELYTNYDTDVANKIIGQLSTRVSKAFGPGTRITNYLEQVFQRSLPALWNTNEGIEAISDVNILASEASKELNKAAEKVLDKSGNRYSPNLLGQIYREAAPQLKEIEDKIEKRLIGIDPNVIPELPDARQYTGKIVEDVETGKKLRSDGQNWIEVQ